MGNIRIVNGDIFQSDADVIVHQVNCQGVMGSGVARQVREKYPYVFQKYQELCSRYKAEHDEKGYLELLKLLRRIATVRNI